MGATPPLELQKAVPISDARGEFPIPLYRHSVLDIRYITSCRSKLRY